MTLPLGVQLYSVREQLKEDFAGVVRRIAAMGYAGVETAGFPEGTTPAQAKALFDELGLPVISAHSPLPMEDKKQQVLDTLQTLDTKYLVLGALPPDEYFKSIDGIYRGCDRLNEASAVCQANGITLVYHNHWWECQPIDGRLPYQVMLERLDPAVMFEIDTYWARTAGIDPVKMVQEVGQRAPLIHIKDGPAVMQQPHLAAGDGVMDFPPIVAAVQSEWLIIELDRCETDMLAAVEKSYQYMTSKGLAHGKQ